MRRRSLRALGPLLLVLPLLGLLAGCRSQPWACCGQECGSECWPGPRIGCPEPCLTAPCPPEPWCPEPPPKPCAPRGAQADAAPGR